MDDQTFISKLLDEAREATEAETNGLMDREDFRILINRLANTIRHLLHKNKDSARAPSAPLNPFGNFQSHVAGPLTSSDLEQELQITSHDIDRFPFDADWV
jgi:hypothetical protein